MDGRAPQQPLRTTAACGGCREGRGMRHMEDGGDMGKRKELSDVSEVSGVGNERLKSYLKMGVLEQRMREGSE